MTVRSVVMKNEALTLEVNNKKIYGRTLSEKFELSTFAKSCRQNVEMRLFWRRSFN